MQFQSTLPHGERPIVLPRCVLLLGFNPRSHTGSDVALFLCFYYSVCFNPRSHTGSDARFFTPSLSIQVSIHAPTRGATLHCMLSVFKKRGFNPRSHTGSDKGEYLGSYACRSHTGSDKRISKWRGVRGVSIHAPTRGATRLVFLQVAYYQFQSTLPHGERLPISFYLDDYVSVSIHAPTRGATQPTAEDSTRE